MVDYEFEVKRSAVAYSNMRDPSLLKYYYKNRTVELMDRTELRGSSPPDIFIGHFDYPNVYIGPLIPPEFGDTSMLGTPERWVGKSMEQIIEMRSSLVRGMYKSSVFNVENGKVEDYIKELGLAERCVDANISFASKPVLRLRADDDSQPYGPSAKLKDFSIDTNITPNKKVESAYSDIDMLASDAFVELYQKGVDISKIQKALSAGLLGIGKNRKFVPTRWSITAVDDTLSKDNLKEVKANESIDKTRVYEYCALDNRWIVMMMPGAWSYELVEAWYPKTVWNENGKDVSIFSSYELFDGRKKYAEIGGCYYAARLATSELLKKEGKQARIVILREAHPGYILPVGVWNVREHVREALKAVPAEFDTFKSALEYAGTKLEIPMKSWITNSNILRYTISQRTLGQYSVKVAAKN